jgi:hypothetical protein
MAVPPPCGAALVCSRTQAQIDDLHDCFRYFGCYAALNSTLCARASSAAVSRVSDLALSYCSGSHAIGRIANFRCTALWLNYHHHHLQHHHHERKHPHLHLYLQKRKWATIWDRTEFFKKYSAGAPASHQTVMLAQDRTRDNAVNSSPWQNASPVKYKPKRFRVCP